MIATEFVDIKKENETSPIPAYQKMLQFSLNNDNYFVLDDVTKGLSEPGDDFGQTHAMGIEYTWKKSNYIRSINFETALFTRAMSSQTANSRRVITQRFREITSLEYSWQKVKPSLIYQIYSLETGLINDHKAIPGLALWQQSGSNGKGGFHDIVGLDTKLTNKSSGGHKFYAGTSFTIGRILPFGLEKYSFFNRINFTGEARLRLRTAFEGSSTSIIAKGKYNFIKHNKKSIFSLNIQTELNYYFESTRTGTTSLLGIQYDNFNFGSQLNFIVPFGEQNERFYKYTDRDPILNFSILYKF
jgi:hypothetical protein